MNTYYHLHIDLDTGKTNYTDCTALFHQWLGGTGAATRCFADYCKTAKKPLDKGSTFFLAIGPLNLFFPVMTKTVALFHSPLNGHMGESHAGGRLSLAMMESKNHIISISGKAPQLSYLVIENQEVRIIKAKSLEGFSANATERILRNKEKGIGKRSILRTGPAGERQSPLACVTVDASRHFGRMGLGAVWGSKNLKAMVISGNHPIPVPEHPEYKKTYQELFQTITRSSAMRKYHNLGTAMNVLPLHHSGALPTRNFTQGFFEGAHQISGEAFAKHELSQQISCAGCPIGCIHLATHQEVFEPEDHMVKSFKTAYDYELIFALGSNLSISSRGSILKIIHEMERQGWDIISMGGTLAWAMDAFQHGVIGKKESLGEVLRFGDGNLILRMLKHVAFQSNDFYADLEKGSAYCSQKYGGEHLAIHFDKIEAPGYLTGIYFMLGLATGVRFSHLDGAGYDIDLQHSPDSSASRKDLLKKLYDEARWRLIFNSLVGCLFSRKVYTPEQTEKCLQIMGMEHFNLSSLDELSHQIHGLKFHCRELLGFNWKKMSLPAKVKDYPAYSGNIHEDEFNDQLKQYQEWIEKDKQSVKF